MREKKNYKGEIITGPRKLKNASFGTGVLLDNGEPIVNWKMLSSFADEDGFDIRNKEPNGNYKVMVTLPVGTIIIRYGNEMGTFTAPEKTDYDDLALPYIKESVEYNEYRVLSPNLEVECIVEKGKVAPGFDSPGGAVQYKHPITIRESIKKKILERVTL